MADGAFLLDSLFEVAPSSDLAADATLVHPTTGAASADASSDAADQGGIRKHSGQAQWEPGINVTPVDPANGNSMEARSMGTRGQ